MSHSRNIGDLERDKFFQPGTTTAQISIPCVSTHLLNLAQSDSTDYTYVNKFGHVEAYTTALVDVNAGTPGIYAWLTSAVQIEAISDDAEDDIDAGTGARTIRVEGLDSNFIACSADIEMEGLTASTATTQTFLRIHRAYVLTSGTYASSSAGSHIGNITIRTKTGGATHIYFSKLPGPVGQSLVARYTIPSGKTGYLLKAAFSSAGNKPSAFVLWRRLNADTVAAPYGAKRVIETFDGISSYFERPWTVPLKLDEKTDIWASAIGEGAGSSSSVSFDILMTHN